MILELQVEPQIMDKVPFSRENDAAKYSTCIYYSVVDRSIVLKKRIGSYGL